VAGTPYFYKKKRFMKNYFTASAGRLLLAFCLGTSGLLTTACNDDNEEVVMQDYAAIDEEIIKKYIADNNIANAQRQTSGLYFAPITTEPNATRAVAGKTVSVLYTGRLLNGTVFDASSQRNNTPIEFVLGAGRVIPGWDEGIALMRKGERATLLIPSGLAYGGRGAGGSIPPNAVLRFEVELVDVK
jgi:FKBP-type peptidyl-prolyl cis-trans isomerase